MEKIQANMYMYLDACTWMQFSCKKKLQCYFPPPPPPLGALKPSELKLIVVDWYWRDLKLRRFCEIPEVQ